MHMHVFKVDKVPKNKHPAFLFDNHKQLLLHKERVYLRWGIHVVTVRSAVAKNVDLLGVSWSSGASVKQGLALTPNRIGH